MHISFKIPKKMDLKNIEKIAEDNEWNLLDVNLQHPIDVSYEIEGLTDKIHMIKIILESDYTEIDISKYEYRDEYLDEHFYALINPKTIKSIFSRPRN